MIYNMLYFEKRGEIMNDEIHNNIEETENLLNSINNSDAIQFSEWTKEKSNLRYNGKLPDFPI